MARSAGKLVFDIVANVAQLQKDMKKAQSTIDSAVGDIRKSFNSLRGTVIGGAAIAGITAIGVAAARTAKAVARSFQNMAQNMDNLSKMSQKYGVHITALSSLKYAAELADVSLEQLAVGMKTLSTQISEGDKIFKQLGINLKDSEGKTKSAASVMAEVADRFSRAEDGANKTAIAVKLFGRSGAELIPLLNEGKVGLERYTKEAEAFGIVISERTGKAAEEFNDSITRLKYSFEGLQMSIITPGALLALADAITYISDAVATLGNMIRQADLGKILGRIEVMMRMLPAVGQLFGASFDIGRYFGKEMRGAAGVPEISGTVRDLTLPGIGAGGSSSDKGKPQWANIIDEAKYDLPLWISAAERARTEFSKTRTEVEKALAVESRLVKEAMELGVLDEKIGQFRLSDIQKRVNALYKSPFPDVKQTGAEKGFSYLQQFAEDAKDTAGMIEQAFVNAFMNVENAIRDMVMTGTANLQDLVRAIGADLIQIFVRSAITGPAADFLGGFFKASGKASGGPVYAGNAYMVGERGPELFVPGTSGRIEPNGSAGGITVQMNIVTQDSNSFRENEPQILNRLFGAMARAQRSLG